jgi:hypothetical protein
MKAEQKMTDVQRKSALEYAQEAFAEKRIGQQPGFVMYDDGTVKASDLGAVCLGWFFRSGPFEEERNPILFQMVVTPNRAKATEEKVQSQEKFIHRYLNWAVKSRMLSPYICEHTVEERKWFVPIAISSVPRNAPLLVSTHVRYLWDRHNNSRNKNVQLIKERFPKWKWEMVMAVACCFTNLDKKEASMGTYSGGHDPFGHASTQRFSAYARGVFNHKWMDSIKFDLSGEGDRGSISQMFNPSRTYFQDDMKAAVKKIIPFKEERYGGSYLPNKKAWEAVEIVKTLLEKRNA